MKHSAHESEDTIQLKIRLSETIRQQLLSAAAGKPFNRAVVTFLGAGASFSDMNLAGVGSPMRAELYDVAVKAFETQERRLARQCRDLNATIPVLLELAFMLAPQSTQLRSVRPRSAAQLFVQGARDKIRDALDIVLKLQQLVADDLPIFTYNYDELLEYAIKVGRPPEARDPGNNVEVRIGLSVTLHGQLAAAAVRNKRTLTAEIRARLECSCAVESFKRGIGTEVTNIVNAAAENMLSSRQRRMASVSDKLYAVIDALETAQAVLNPLSGVLRPVRSKSDTGRELMDARNRIRTALAAVQRLVESEPDPPSTSPLGNG